jgi:hypothetical protein
MARLFISNVLGSDLCLLERFIIYYNRFNPYCYLFTLNTDENFHELAKFIIHRNCRNYVIQEWNGEFNENDKVEKEHALIDLHCLDDDYIIYADSDEFQYYPDGTLEGLMSGGDYLAGKLLERVSIDGSLTVLDNRLLEEQYPLGGSINSLTGACPYKIVCARKTVELDKGHHGLKDQDAIRDWTITVHHFKWYDGTIDRFKREMNLTHESLEMWRIEHSKFLEHFNTFGKININDPWLGFKHVDEVLNI